MIAINDFIAYFLENAPLGNMLPPNASLIYPFAMKLHLSISVHKVDATCSAFPSVKGTSSISYLLVVEAWQAGPNGSYFFTEPATYYWFRKLTLLL